METCLEQPLGQTIRRLRERSGINKTRFCLMCGISRPYLNEIETGKANITIHVLARIAENLDTSASELLRMAEERAHGDDTA